MTDFERSANQPASFSKQRQNTMKIQELQSFGLPDKGIIGSLPLIKRVQILDSVEYELSVYFDYDSNTMKFVARNNLETLELNLLIENECPKEPAFLHQKAEQIVS